MSNKSLTIGVLIAIVIAIGAYFFPVARNAFGTAASDVQNTVYSGIVTAQLFVGGSTPASSIGQATAFGTCNSGIYAASSTLFSVQNPFNATSTVTVQVVSGMGQATSSSLQVGTSTASVGLTSGVTAFINATVATSAPFWISGGVQVGSAGYNTAGANTFRTIVIGPNEFVDGYSTSTATGGGANSYVPGLTCSYKLDYRN